MQKRTLSDSSSAPQRALSPIQESQLSVEQYFHSIALYHGFRCFVIFCVNGPSLLYDSFPC